VLAAACKAAAAGIRGIASRPVLTTRTPKPYSQWDEWAHRRLRLGSRIVGGGCLDDAEWSQVEPARRLVLLRSELPGSSFARFRVPALPSSTAHHR
jgi:hypothetical protein